MLSQQWQYCLAAELVVRFVDQDQPSGVLQHADKRVMLERGSSRIVRAANNNHIRRAGRENQRVNIECQVLGFQKHIDRPRLQRGGHQFIEHECWLWRHQASARSEGDRERSLNQFVGSVPNQNAVLMPT